MPAKVARFGKKMVFRRYFLQMRSAAQHYRLEAVTGFERERRDSTLESTASRTFALAQSGLSSMMEGGTNFPVEDSP